MATYNGEKYIREQLDSIARQDLLPMELIVADDGSVDATLEIVDAFARNAPFTVRVFRNESRLGYADNFLKAASLCTGDVIAFCDQDDIWMEQKLRVFAGFFEDPEVLLAAHSAWTLLESGERGHQFPRFARSRVSPPAATDPFSFVHGFAIAIRRELLRIVPAIRPKNLMGHDQWYWFLATSAGKIATAADVLALYRQHQGNVFGARRASTISEMAKAAIYTSSYDSMAKTELDCSHILLAAAEQWPDRAVCLKTSASRLELRARLHRIRHQIYSERSSLLRRLVAFFRILLLTGYLPDSSHTRLGPRAAIKDAIFGLSGAYKI